MRDFGIAGARVSLDLASFNVVEESKGFLSEIVSDYVDILIANEDDARAYTGCSDEQRAIEKLAEEADIAVLKVGERGSFIGQNGNVVAIDPVNPGRAVDTTVSCAVGIRAACNYPISQ